MKKLSDFKQMEKNPNLHTDTGLKLLKKSIDKYGYITPMTATADGTIIDGNARLEKVSEQMSSEDPIIIHHDGTRPIIAVRDDIACGTDKKAKEIAIMANRVGQVNISWNVPELKNLALEDFDLKGLGFTYKKFIEEEKIDAVKIFALEINFNSEIELKTAYDKFQSEGYKCKILIL